MTGTVIVGGARTPMGRFRGALATFSATALGAVAIEAALRRSGVEPGAVDHVLMGHVIQAGCGQQGARAAAVGGGIPMSVPAATVNKACLSGLSTITAADQMIRSGAAEIVVAGGMESMTNTPHLLLDARRGYGFGQGRLEDALAHDGLRCSFEGCAMGELAERELPALPRVTRARQDELAARSHALAAAAADRGDLVEEIAAVAVEERGRPSGQVTGDEGVRRGVDVDDLARLDPVFRPDGAVTAGNASQISDGAAAVVVMAATRADQLGLEPLGEIVASASVAGPDPLILRQGGRAAAKMLDRVGLAPSAVDRFEINEAFAAAVLASADDLGIDEERVNVNGGAIALGHPVGMSGTRLALTLLLGLRRRGGGTGVAALCGGGGQGEALLVRST